MNTKTTLASLVLAFTACQAQVHLHLNTWLDDPSLFGGSAAVSYDGASRVALAGQIRASGPGIALVGYCTDFGFSLNGGWFIPVDISVAPGPGNPNPTWTPGGIQRAAWASQTFGPLVTSDDQAVALQLAVWELLIDAEPSGDSGRLRFVHSGARSIVAQVPDAPIVDGTWWMPSDALGDYRGAQGLIGTEVPEPSTWAAGIILALAGIWRATR